MWLGPRQGAPSLFMGSVRGADRAVRAWQSVVDGPVHEAHDPRGPPPRNQRRWAKRHQDGRPARHVRGARILRRPHAHPERQRRLPVVGRRAPPRPEAAIEEGLSRAHGYAAKIVLRTLAEYQRDARRVSARLGKRSHAKAQRHLPATVHRSGEPHRRAGATPRHRGGASMSAERCSGRPTSPPCPGRG